MTIRRTTVFILCVVFSLATTMVDAADQPASSLKGLLSSLMKPTLAANTTSVDHYLMRFCFEFTDLPEVTFRDGSFVHRVDSHENILY